jgi:hypothetical protein
MHYQEQLDKIFGKGSLWKHRTLRTVFDPFSSEYDKTSIDEKLEILKKSKESGLELSEIIDGYKTFYIEENKPNVINSIEDGLKLLLENSLK